LKVDPRLAFPNPFATTAMLKSSKEYDSVRLRRSNERLALSRDSSRVRLHRDEAELRILSYVGSASVRAGVHGLVNHMLHGSHDNVIPNVQEERKIAPIQPFRESISDDGVGVRTDHTSSVN
jgi:hypothetical protein